MSIARLLAASVLLVASGTAWANETVRVPSDPTSWAREQLGLPAGTKTCPGGEMSKFLELVPQLKPQSFRAYEAGERVSLNFLIGLLPTDQLYPFNFTTKPAVGAFFGMRGFFLVRGDCIIHVQATGFDN